MTDRHQAASYPLRMPTELRQRLEEAADASGRSMNAEIVTRLEQSLHGEHARLKREEVVAIVRATLEELKVLGTPRKKR